MQSVSVSEKDFVTKDAQIMCNALKTEKVCIFVCTILRIF